MNEVKTTKIVEKTVVTTKPTILFNDETLLEIGMSLKGSTPVEMITVTEANTGKKTGNPYYEKSSKTWLVEKVCRLNGLFGTNYENALKKATGDSEVKAQEHKWAVHYKDSSVVMINKNDDQNNPQKFYFAFRPLRPDDIIYRWKDSKAELTDEQVAELKSFITPKDSSPVVWRTYNISNIIELNMNKLRYYRARI